MGEFAQHSCGTVCAFARLSSLHPVVLTNVRWRTNVLRFFAQGVFAGVAILPENATIDDGLHLAMFHQPSRCLLVWRKSRCGHLCPGSPSCP